MGLACPTESPRRMWTRRQSSFALRTMGLGIHMHISYEQPLLACSLCSLGRSLATTGAVGRDRLKSAMIGLQCHLDNVCHVSLSDSLYHLSSSLTTVVQAAIPAQDLLPCLALQAIRLRRKETLAVSHHPDLRHSEQRRREQKHNELSDFEFSKQQSH